MRSLEEGFMINLDLGALLDIGGSQAGNPKELYALLKHFGLLGN